MKTITFISHYNAIRVNVRLSDEKAESLLNNKWYSAIKLYNKDCQRVFAGQQPLYLSKSQLRRLTLPGIDYFDAVEIDGNTIYDEEE